MTDKIVKLLSEPFSPEKVKRRVGGFNPSTGQNEVYDYISADDVLERLRTVFGATFSVRVTHDNVMDNKNSQKKFIVIGVELSYVDQSGTRHSAAGFGGKDITSDPGSDYKAALSKAVKSASKVWGVPIDGGLETPETEDDSTSSSDSSRTPPRPSAGVSSAPVPVPVAPKPVASTTMEAPAPKPAAPAAPKPVAPAPVAVKPAVQAPAPASVPASAPVPAQTAVVPKGKSAVAPPPPPPKVTLDDIPPEEEYDEDEAEAVGSDEEDVCSDCSAKIEDFRSPVTGEVIPKDEVIEVSIETFEVPLCGACVGTRRRSMDEDE